MATDSFYGEPSVFQHQDLRTDFGDNYGERVRGFITIPTTGNYYFWIAGSDSAELWISNDKEPANKVRRAYVSPTANPAPPPDNPPPGFVKTDKLTTANLVYEFK